MLLKFIDLIGQKFGRLVVIQKMNNNKHRQSRWLCKCYCNDKNIVIVQGCHLKSGHTKSCGCLRDEIIRETGIKNIKHGHSKRKKITKIYISWHNMKQRCTNFNDKGYKDYGYRGITICERWLKFENFNKDMGESWRPRLTIHRKNNNKGYYPENCVWITTKEQNKNKRNNLYITHNNKTQLLIDWVKETRIPYQTLWARIYRYGWSTGKALTVLVSKGKK